MNANTMIDATFYITLFTGKHTYFATLQTQVPCPLAKGLEVDLNDDDWAMEIRDIRYNLATKKMEYFLAEGDEEDSALDVEVAKEYVKDLEALGWDVVEN